jgi:predicted nucleic acid-binding protein
MIFVLDTSAMLAYLKNETGADVVESLLLDAGNTCFAHAVNLCEVFYTVRRREGEADAQLAVATLLDVSVLPREDQDQEFWLEAGRIKSEHPHMGLGDCYCAVLARRVNGEAVTGDHPDFEPFHQAGRCVVRFIR